MSIKVEPGTYQCKTTGATIYEAPSGAVMCRIGLDIGLTGGICLIQKDGTLSERGFKDAAAILEIEGGWDWALWSREPGEWAGHDVEAVIDMVQGEHGEFSSVKYLNVPGGGQMQKADAKSLAAKYGAKTRALFGGAPSAPKPKPVAPPPPAGKGATIEEAWEKWGKPEDVDGFYAHARTVTGKADHNEIGPDGWAAVIDAMAEDNLPF